MIQRLIISNYLTQLMTQIKRNVHFYVIYELVRRVLKCVQTIALYIG